MKYIVNCVAINLSKSLNADKHLNIIAITSEHFWKLGLTSEDIIKIELGEICCEDGNWIELVFCCAFRIVEHSISVFMQKAGLNSR
jgi:hypothetical protein